MYGKNEKKKMLSGRLYCPQESEELAKDVKKCRMLVRPYNGTTEEQKSYRDQLLSELLGSRGNFCRFEPPIHFDFGCNTYIDERFYSNYDCIILDVNKVVIGDNVVIGSGSVVTKDIPSNVVAAGNPCRVIREITQKDKEYWSAQRDEYFQNDD